MKRFYLSTNFQFCANFSKLLVFIYLAVIFSACSVVPRFSSNTRYNGEKNDNLAIDTARVGEVYTGLASYYADKFNGRTTSNGETYDMYGLTAAHPTLPFGSILRITNLKNYKSVIVRVNDRMPVHPERIIDLSLGTAQALDMVKDGVVNVQIEVLELGY